MKPSRGGLEVVAQLRPSLILGIILLAAIVVALVLFVTMRGRTAAGAVGRAQTVAQAACMAFTLLGVQLYILATTTAPAVALLAKAERVALPFGGRLLAVLGQNGNLPTYQGSFALSFMLAGGGFWLAARSEAARREDGLPAVQRIALLMTSGAVVLAAVSCLSIAGLWGLIPSPRGTTSGGAG